MDVHFLTTTSIHLNSHIPACQRTASDAELTNQRLQLFGLM